MLSREFVNEVVNAVKVLVPTMEVECQKTLKNNNVELNGVIIKEPNRNMHPTIYIENFVGERDVNKIAKEIVEIYHKHSKECDECENIIKAIRDYGNARQLLRVRLINKKNNTKVFNEVPYLPFLDMAIIVVVDIGIGTIKVTNKMLEEWHISNFEDLVCVAKENTFKTPYVLKSIEELLDLTDMLTEEMVIQMHTLTNEELFYGATEICNEKTMQEIANKLNADLIVLPSSVHEVVIMPKFKDVDFGYLTYMVREVNRRDVSPDEVLSDHYYLYSRENGWSF